MHTTLGAAPVLCVLAFGPCPMEKTCDIRGFPLDRCMFTSCVCTLFDQPEYALALGSCHALKPAYVFIGDADSQHVQALITHLNDRGQFVSAEVYRASARAAAVASSGTTAAVASAGTTTAVPAGSLKRVASTRGTYAVTQQKAVKPRFS